MAAKAAGIHSFGLLRTVAGDQDTAAIEARAFGFDGKVIDIPVVNRARAMIARHDTRGLK